MNINWIGIRTLMYKELLRSFRVPFQTVGQPVVSTLLYFLVFGYAMGTRIGNIEGLSYTEFIMPGLIMMNVVTIKRINKVGTSIVRLKD